MSSFCSPLSDATVGSGINIPFEFEILIITAIDFIIFMLIFEIVKALYVLSHCLCGRIEYIWMNTYKLSHQIDPKESYK